MNKAKPKTIEVYTDASYDYFTNTARIGIYCPFEDYRYSCYLSRRNVHNSFQAEYNAIKISFDHIFQKFIKDTAGTTSFILYSDCLNAVVAWNSNHAIEKIQVIWTPRTTPGIEIADRLARGIADSNVFKCTNKQKKKFFTNM